MKNLFLIPAVCALLIGCAPGSAIGGIAGLATGASIASQAPVVTAKTEQALTVAHYAYEEIGSVVIAAVHSGALRGSNAAKVKIYYDAAGDALKIADKADAAANEEGITAALSDAYSAIFSIKQLVGK